MNKNVKKAFVLIVILIVLVVTILVMSATKPKTAAVESKVKVWQVNAVSVVEADISPVYSLLGRVESNYLVSAASPINGVVERVWLREGESFKKGQNLVSLAKEDLELPVAIAKANVESIQAKLKLNKLSYLTNKQNLNYENELLAIRQNDLVRNERLKKRNLSSATRLEQAKEALVRQQKAVASTKLMVAQFESMASELQASLKVAQINVEQAELNLQRGNLVAPFDGKITQVSVSEGDSVNVGKVMIRFYKNSSLELRATIPNIHLANIYQSVKSGKKLVASYQFNKKEYLLPLTRFAGESSAGGLDAFLQIPNELSLVSSSVSLGGLMQVDLKGDFLKGVFAVPYSALYGVGKVFVIDKETNELIRKKVQKYGVDSQNNVLIKGSLNIGDLVLTTHLPNAITGLKVVVNKELNQGSK